MELEETDGPLSPKELLVNDIGQQEDKISSLKKKLTLLVWTLRIINFSGWITQAITALLGVVTLTLSNLDNYDGKLVGTILSSIITAFAALELTIKKVRSNRESEKEKTTDAIEVQKNVLIKKNIDYHKANSDGVITVQEATDILIKKDE